MASVPDKVILPPLPPESGQDTWRSRANAAILATTGCSSALATWLGDAQNVRCPFSSLIMRDPVLESLDRKCKLFMAILDGVGATTTENGLADHARTACTPGCGRQLLRLLIRNTGVTRWATNDGSP